MSKSKPLPAMKPCPCGNDKVCVSQWLREWNVFCGVCDRRGEAKKTRRGAVDSWNSDWNRTSPVDVEAAERRGAMAAVAWFRRMWIDLGGTPLVAKNFAEMATKLQSAIERGEVLPVKGKRT